MRANRSRVSERLLLNSAWFLSMRSRVSLLDVSIRSRFLSISLRVAPVLSLASCWWGRGLRVAPVLRRGRAGRVVLALVPFYPVTSAFNPMSQGVVNVV